LNATADYRPSQLNVLEAESLHIIREVAAEFEGPALLFSGGKDSLVMLRLAKKASYPAAIPFPVLHVDTGHNFPEVVRYRTVGDIALHRSRTILGLNRRRDHQRDRSDPDHRTWSHPSG
jgi:predicted phosphoadenosine phosphosulfate sulfurtransferase